MGTVGVLLLSLLSTACLGGRRTGVQGAEPISGRPDSLERPEVHALTLEPGEQGYRISILTHSAESNVSASARQHRTLKSGEFRAVLHSESPYGFSLQLTTVRASIDSSTTPDQKLGELDIRQAQPVDLSFDTTGWRSFLVPPATTGKEQVCTAGSSLLSPLLARLLVISPLITTRRHQEVLADSLRYSSCADGVQLHTTAQIITRAESGTIPGISHRADIQGTLRADSTRNLPMHLQGVFTGIVLITPDTTRQGWVQSLDMTITVELTAASALKQQIFSQTVRTLVTSH